MKEGPMPDGECSKFDDVEAQGRTEEHGQDRALFIGQTFYESDFGTTTPMKHPIEIAIERHDLRKVLPGYNNRGWRKGWKRWLNGRLNAIFQEGVWTRRI